jgi:hypothetical protein
LVRRGILCAISAKETEEIQMDKNFLTHNDKRNVIEVLKLLKNLFDLEDKIKKSKDFWNYNSHD